MTSQIVVSVDTGAAALPLTATLCQSNPSTGACLATPSGSVTLNYAAQASPTFSVFLQAKGAIPFAPATSRISPLQGPERRDPRFDQRRGRDELRVRPTRYGRDRRMLTQIRRNRAAREGGLRRTGTGYYGLGDLDCDQHNCRLAHPRR
ncbi:MAG: hypothetical protein WDN69_06360 [Aliidongia sp.]